MNPQRCALVQVAQQNCVAHVVQFKHGVNGFPAWVYPSGAAVTLPPQTN